MFSPALHVLLIESKIDDLHREASEHRWRAFARRQRRSGDGAIAGRGALRGSTPRGGGHEGSRRPAVAA
jgi:hypothetical protein